MSAKITKRVVDTLAPGAIIADSEIRGFVARRLPSGAVSYGYRYRLNGKQRWLPLGLHGRITPDEARGLAKRAAGAVAHGNDPQAERAGARAAAAATVNKVLDGYLRSIEERKLRSAPEIASIFDRLVRLQMGERSIYDLTRDDITTLLDLVAEERGPVMSDKVLDYLSAAFHKHALRDSKFNSPIVRGMSRTKTSERARERTLTDDEIRDLWAALDEMPPAYAAFLRTLLLTGQRRDEVRRAQWSELDGDNWVIPSSRFKGKREQQVPITEAVKEQFAKVGLHRKGFIFSRDGGRVPLSSLSTLKRRLEAKIAARRGGKPLPDWRLHDLRRTARTLLSRAKVPADIGERVLGHAMPSLRKTYDKFEFVDEKREALEKLAALIERILQPDATVVTFPVKPPRVDEAPRVPPSTIELPPITGEIEMKAADEGDTAAINGLVPDSRSRHGPRTGRAKRDWALYAIAMIDSSESIARDVKLFSPLSKDVNQTELTEAVNEYLGKEPEYKATGQGEISRNTVRRAFRDFARTK